MSTPVEIAVIGFVLVNVVGLLLSCRSWLRFAIFYLMDIAIFLGLSAAIILTAPYVAEGWEGRTMFFGGYQVANSDADLIGWGVLWLILMAVGALLVFFVKRIPPEAWEVESDATTSDDA